MFSLALVCLSVSRLMPKLFNRLPHSSVEKRHTDYGRNRWIFVVNRITFVRVRVSVGMVRCGHRHTLYGMIYVTQRLFIGNNFETSKALAEVCVLLSAVLVCGVFL